MSQKKGWDDLVFGAIETLANAPSRLKDSKESVGQAIDWVKSLRDDIQARIAEEIPSRLSQMDWDSMSKKMADYLAENYEAKIEMKIKLVPRSKRRAESAAKASDEEEPST